MTGRLRKFISLEMNLSDPTRGQTLQSFAAKMVFISISLSMVVSFFVILMAEFFQVLPVPLWNAVSYSVIMAWIVGGIVALILCSVLGNAIRQLRQSHAQFERLSRTDTLSGLANRRAFNQSFDEVETDASLAIFDLDRFKSINDNFGHVAGDMVIKRAATAIADVFGEFHCVARLGGEEFAVIVRGGTRKDRVTLIELARIRVACLTILLGGKQVQTTVSVGVADIGPERSKHDTFAAADRALYVAKSSGRNCVCHEDEVAHAVEELNAALLVAS